MLWFKVPQTTRIVHIESINFERTEPIVASFFRESARKSSSSARIPRGIPRAAWYGRLEIEALPIKFWPLESFKIDESSMYCGEWTMSRKE